MTQSPDVVPQPGQPGTPEPVPQAEDAAGLGEKVTRGLKWSVMQQGVGRVASMLSGIVLARVLVPEDFGVFAVALVLVNVLFGLNDLGLLLAVARWRGDVRQAASTASTLAIGFSCFLYLVCFIGAPAFADAMGSPDSAPILRLLLVVIVIDGVTTVPFGLLTREFRQDRVALAELFAFPVGIVVSIGLALLGAGAWSLAVGQVAANLVAAGSMLRFAPFIPMPGFHLPTARSLLRFGLPLAATSALEYLLLSADYVVVGRTLGPVALGLYALAYNVSSWPVTSITEAVRRVSIVGFANLETDPEALRRGFRRTFVLLMRVTLPVSLALGILAEPLIRVLYGAKWQESADVLRYLALLGGARVAIGFIFDVLVGNGRTARTMGLKAVWLVALVPALVVGSRLGGITGVAVAHLVLALTVALPAFLLGGARALGMDLSGIAHDLRRPFAGAAIAAVVGAAASSLVSTPIVQLLLGGSVLLGTYVALTLSRSEIRATVGTVRRTQVQAA